MHIHWHTYIFLNSGSLCFSLSFFLLSLFLLFFFLSFRIFYMINLCDSVHSLVCRLVVLVVVFSSSTFQFCLTCTFDDFVLFDGIHKSLNGSPSIFLSPLYYFLPTYGIWIHNQWLFAMFAFLVCSVWVCVSAFLFFFLFLILSVFIFLSVLLLSHSLLTLLLTQLTFKYRILLLSAMVSACMISKNLSVSTERSNEITHSVFE